MAKFPDNPLPIAVGEYWIGNNFIARVERKNYDSSCTMVNITNKSRYNDVPKHQLSKYWRKVKYPQMVELLYV